jgi:O-antigen/teichoic acid export membrane protein
VGQYTAALALARLLLVGLTALGYIFLPVATRFFRLGDREALGTTYATATKWMTLVSLPLFLLFFFLPGGSLGFVYGADFAGGGLALRILVAGAFASTLVGPSAMTLIALGRTRLLLVNAAAGAAVDVGAAAALVPSRGADGAALAWAASIVVLPALSLAELAALEGVHPFRRDFLKPLAATAIPLGLLFAWAPVHPPLWSLPLVVVLIAGAFALAVFATGSVDRGDRILLEIAEGILGRRIPAVRPVAGWFARRRSRPVSGPAQPNPRAP